MRARWPLLLAPILMLWPASLRAEPPKSKPIERIVALVDGKPIWLSELRHDARTLRAQLEQIPAAKRREAQADVWRQLLDRLIARRLFARAAREQHISVEPAEVDKALERIAELNQIPVAELLKQAKAAGLPEADYRAEVAAQILEGKLVSLRVRPTHGGNPEQEVAAAHARLLKELREKSLVEIRLMP